MAATVLQPPSASQIRDELEDLVIRDLLGPAGGPAEEIEDAPRDRYLVGMLAPRRQFLAPETFDDLAVGGEGAPEEGSVDVSAPQATTMFPSSFGMTFSVDGSTRALQVAARWGHYERVESAVLKNDAGNPRMVWKRRPIESTSAPIPLKPGPLKWSVTPEFPEVTVQGLVRAQQDDWIVTLFLVNGQEEPKQLRNTAWLFQPELIVTTPNKSPSFLRRPQNLDLVHADAEDRAMAMIYRSDVEFAVGHGVSVHADRLPGDVDRAVRLSTRVVPVGEVPQVTAPTSADLPGLSGLVLDMKVLADTDSADFAAKLGPVAVAYREWIQAQTTRISDAGSGLGQFQDDARAAMQRCTEALERIEAGVTLLGTSAQAAEAFGFLNRAMWRQRSTPSSPRRFDAARKL